MDVSVTSGFNAIAHAVEALYAPDASPIVSLMAEEGVRSLAASLPLIASGERPVDHNRRAGLERPVRPAGVVTSPSTAVTRLRSEVPMTLTC
ncbi:hypothetical protein B6E66_00485 [Streptomyces maremycinicus]|nr:hypothetical protein B6E66_00485 [Streptomyces sp. B9173]